MFYSAILGVLICALLLATESLLAGPSIQRITYRGWADSYRMTAGKHSLVVVPEIGGRIMEYSIDGRNVIWENAAEFGRTYDIANDWRNFGGYKTWVSPQDHWHWPPDPLLDRGKANIELFDREGRKWMRIIGCPSLDSGVVFIKELTMADNGEITLVQRMRAIGKCPTDWGVHDITQVRTPCLVVFPLRRNPTVPGGLQYLAGDPAKTTQFTVHEGLCITEYKGQEYQISAQSDGPWMIWFKDNLAYVKVFPPMRRDALYGDSNSSVTVFTSDAKLGYLEMEVLGPLTALSPGQEAELTESWRIYKLDHPVNSRDMVKTVIAQMEKRGWIPAAR